jgi:hypothetical protein
MGIFDRGMLRILHARLGPVEPAGVPITVDAWIDDRSEAGLVVDAQTVRWRLAGEATWQTVLLAAAGADSFTADLPPQVPGTVVEYYLTAADHSGRSETLPRTAPEGWYSFEVDPEATSVPAVTAAADLRAWPNPGNPRVNFAWDRPGAVDLAIHDLRGRRVRVLPVMAGQLSAAWDGCDDRGRASPSGRYLSRLRFTAGTVTCTVTLVR